LEPPELPVPPPVQRQEQQVPRPVQQQEQQQEPPVQHQGQQQPQERHPWQEQRLLQGPELRPEPERWLARTHPASSTCRS
jgi:hypothetical protein